ncbi:MAG: methionyl-tRNA formyltransferase [Candidatus Nitrohelix vancouverensis]|uniref:Methionyl-tRNA formyltransferase n=1 Tax=Candidatus Nitrohelix vancouverensis TaxID=2705534 RepID=A0A7T0C592_9BACT|nr:MAG: methionyl-tRNA formyltransferase [Candidatus Nitrohelix vancouverensis]
MNLVFMGSPEFAVPTLEALVASEHCILAVVTQPDRPKGRGQSMTAPAVKVCAEKHGLKVLQPEKARDPQFIATLKDLNPDLIVVVAYGQILSQELLDIPKHFCMNVHSSLLPKYRGAAPINWAIIDGEAETGVTTMKLVHKLDAGDILLTHKLPIRDEDDAQTLHDALAEAGAPLTLETLAKLEAGTLTPIAQDESQVTYASKLKKEDGLIDWNHPARAVWNRIRGVHPWPGAYSFLKGRRLRICKAESTSGEAGEEPGRVVRVSGAGIEVGTTDGRVLITELQPEGKKRLPVKSFLAGNSVAPGDAFTMEPATSNER